jgi:hypothetical protein
MRRLSILFLAVCAAACGSEDPSPDADPTTATTASALQGESCHANPALFPKGAHPYGRSQEDWSELMWSYIYAQPIDHNPFLDVTGADCAIGQSGPVWFLPAVPGATLGRTVTRSCTIPQHRAILLQLASSMNDYPCPDPTFQPAPGQTLFDFLITPIKPGIDAVSGFEVALDGVPIRDPLGYRFTSHDVFTFTGNPSLTESFDVCVTGRPQQAVADGYFLMFKPMSPGHHVIVVNGHDMHGTPVTLTENLTIAGGASHP